MCCCFSPAELADPARGELPGQSEQGEAGEVAGAFISIGIWRPFLVPLR